MVANIVWLPHLRYIALTGQWNWAIQPLGPPQVRFSPSLRIAASISSFSRPSHHITSLHSCSMSPDRRQDRSLNGLSGNLDVATTTGPFALQFTTTSDHIVQLATVLLPTDGPTTSSISASSPGGPLLKVIISLSTVLGFAILAAAVLLCWTRQRLRARQKRVLLPAPWPGGSYRASAERTSS